MDPLVSFTSTPHTPRRNQPHIVVLGAGVCGLYTARTLLKLGARVTLIERLDEVGGLATGYVINGNHYDIGVHHLHAFDQEIFEDILDITRNQMHPVELSAKIKHGNGYRRYPLELADLLIGIPPWTLLHCLFGLLRQQFRNRKHPTEATDAEEALIQLYGEPLYHYFFRDFTHKYWGIPPCRLSATFVKRKMPRLSAVDFLKNALDKMGFKQKQAVESALRKETLYFSSNGAVGMPKGLARFIEQRGGRILLGAEVEQVHAQNKQVSAITYRQHGTEHTLHCDGCISTIPLNVLVGNLDPQPDEATLDASKALKYKAIAVYGFLIKKPRVLSDALYVYFRNRIFHRVSEPKNSGVQVQPPHYTTLLAEMTCEEGDARWNGDAGVIDQVIRDLEAEGLIEADDVAETHVLTARHGYPIYQLGFEPFKEKLEEHVASITNLRSAGRQGGFCYPNMHTAMRMGAEAATAIMKQVYGHPPKVTESLVEVK